MLAKVGVKMRNQKVSNRQRAELDAVLARRHNAAAISNSGWERGRRREGVGRAAIAGRWIKALNRTAFDPL